MALRRTTLILLIGTLLVGAATALRVSAQPAPTATPVIFVPPTRTPVAGGDHAAATTAQPAPQLLRDATRTFPPTNTPRPSATPRPVVTTVRPRSNWRWPYVGALSVEPGNRRDSGVFRVAMGMLRVRAAHMRGADRVVFFISANGQPPTILGIDTDLSDGASVPWLMLSREMDALITAVAANEARVGLPALPIRAVFAGD